MHKIGKRQNSNFAAMLSNGSSMLGLSSRHYIILEWNACKQRQSTSQTDTWKPSPMNTHSGCHRRSRIGSMSRISFEELNESFATRRLMKHCKTFATAYSPGFTFSGSK